ncbi:FAD-binding protein [Sporolactobacillus sp. THM7-7]|nr:FAD-binding protein [Sporolactobacillus sp. THM7-7]
MQAEADQQLLKIVHDRKRILSQEEDLVSYGYDASFGFYRPDLVVQATSSEEVAGVLKLANRFKIPVTPRGQASSLSGGPLPVKGGIVLDVSQWNQKLVIDSEDLVAVVSPGVVTAQIDKAAAKYGLMYPPDPSSSRVSTIAGNLAENSGGPRCLKYGVTKDYVIGLEVVTPQGEIIRTGGRTVKNVTGYDLTKLIVGSEGTLGVITEATLRLMPRPPASRTIMIIFDRFVDSGKMVSKILTSGILPAKVEMMDQASIRAVEAYRPLGLPTDAEAILLVALDGHPAAIDDESDKIKEVAKATGARSVSIARSDEEARKLWKARKLVSPAIVRSKPTKISEDATVPRSKIPEFCARLQEIKKKYHIDLVVFGHAGDGNLHPNIICDKRNKEEMKVVEKAVEAIFRAALDLGGTLSGEHGIGTMKSAYMPWEFSPESLDMMKRIKNAWDPNNILNPSKIFPVPGQRLVLSE